MKTPFVFISILLAAALLAGCGVVRINTNTQSITPSDNKISETRSVSGFRGVDLRTLGKVILTQGDKESLVIKGSDNLVPLIKTRVSGGVLYIELDDNYSIQNYKSDDVLTYEVSLKSVENLTVSGLGSLEMAAAEAKDLRLVMSGSGAIFMNKVTANSVDMTVSGLGKVVVIGSADKVKATISGAGEINAQELKCRTASANISGLGNASLWVTDELGGSISGSGDVHYYGSPKVTNTTTTGLGKFNNLGAK